MDESRLKDWEPLFRHALKILDAAEANLATSFTWSFGGGTVLMLKYGHRYSRDVDIFLRDPQFIGHMTPRLSPTAEDVTDQYEEGHEFVKLRLPNGEIDFIATGWLTDGPFVEEEILNRRVNVETPAEIIGKKIRHRAATFKARDLFDLAVVLDNAPDEISKIAPIVREQRDVLRERVDRHRALLREEFEALDLFQSTKTLDECVAALERALVL